MGLGKRQAVVDCKELLVAPDLGSGTAGYFQQRVDDVVTLSRTAMQDAAKCPNLC